MISIAVCDDEEYMRTELRRQIGSFLKAEGESSEIRLFESGGELLRSGFLPDILFLDIQMGPPNGMETAKALREKGFRGSIIFITVLKEPVFDAFWVGAFDYLLKPVGEGAIEKTMRRLFSAWREENAKRLCIRRNNDIVIVRHSEIEYCEVVDRKIYLHKTDGSVVDYYGRFRDLEQELGRNFCRCHRSYLLNLSYLSSFAAGQAVMLSGAAVPVSRSCGVALSKAVLHFMEGRNGI